MKRPFVLLLIFSAFGVMTSCKSTPNTTVQAVVTIDSLMQAHFPQDGPAAAIAILQGEDILMMKAYGTANMPTQTQASTATLFCLASISKQFTATAILQLCEQGKMSLHDPVRTYFPHLTHPIWDSVEVWHLLAHTSGIPDARGHYPLSFKLAAGDDEDLDYLDTLTWRRFSPGEAYEYINPTFVMAGKMIEQVSGEEFAAYMRHHIFEPAGMQHCFYWDAKATDPLHDTDVPNLVAHGYAYEDSTWQEYDFGEEIFFATRPDGALYCSIEEFILWEKALRNELIVSNQTIAQAWSPKTLVTGSPYDDYNVRENTYYGFGWFIEPATDTTHTVIYHTGENGGFNNIAARYPDNNTLVVILSARPDWDQYTFLQRIEEVLHL